MTDNELAPQFDPSDIEIPLYRAWEDRGLFRPDARDSKPFVVVIPPPNVTDILHMGHGLNNTVQDVAVRFERMRGRATLWVPGTDHAGIATQNVVERLLHKEGKTRFDLGREAFVRRVEQYVAEKGTTILEQLKAIGASCDWSRTAYTLSPQLSRAVREVFVRLWEEDLIYRGHRVVHWCSRCLTSLSDEEAEHSELDGKLYHVRYELVGSPGPGGRDFITVATTRPETILGDVAVAVSPEDTAKQAFVGRRVKVPIIGLEIPIVADEAVELGFGSGFLKLTPAHDANDFEAGRRHGLPSPIVLTPDGRMADAELGGKAGGRVPEPLFGMDRFEAREEVVAMLRKSGALEKVESHHHAVRRCYRCDTVVEPRLSDQWFVRMQPLAKPALEAYRRGEITFIPQRRGDEYERWLENIRDWNVSRQIWWGHRIPVWYCDACNTSKAFREDPAACPSCGAPMRQDEDVLDTWFSSWLWPFSTLGWPDDTEDLKRYYPTDLLVTAPEILFFWVARMIFAGLHFMGKPPFHTVYLHGTVRDTQHRKMSKSLGNGIDPIVVDRLYGADALRFTVLNGLAVGTDIVLDPQDLETSFAPGRNFANKLWNVGRLVISHMAPIHDAPRTTQPHTLADRWILSRLQQCVQATTAHLEAFRYNEASATPYHFLWDEFADWYLEAIKPRLYGDEPGGDAARQVARRCFETVLQLLHPIMPFITDALYQRLPGNASSSIMISRWPEPDGSLVVPGAEADFARLQAAITAIRTVRAEARINPGTVVSMSVAGMAAPWRDLLLGNRVFVQRLAKVTIEETTFGGPAVNALLPDGSTIPVQLPAADLKKECARLRDERARLDKQLTALRAKLSNEGFLAKAPATVVEGERAKERDWSAKLDALAAELEARGC